MIWRIDVACFTPSGRNVVIQVEAPGPEPLAYADLISALNQLRVCARNGQLTDCEDEILGQKKAPRH